MNTSSDLANRRQLAVPRGVATATPVFAARAENAEIWDTEGRRYIDFAGGIGVLATGHRHPRVLAAVRDQLDRFTHTAFQVMAYEPYIQLAERLNRLAPFSGAAKTLLVTTGAEAVENAIKIARIATGRTAVIAFNGAFHGRTQLALNLTGKMSPYRTGVATSGTDVFRVPFPITHLGVEVHDTMTALESLFHNDVEPGRVAAILLEPVQGEGGFHVAPPDLLRALRQLCDRHGIVLVADEIQSGIGRTGRMFAVEHSGVEPDLVTVAKSLAGGFPLAGVIGRAELMEQVVPGGLGGTYGGSPIGCAAALAVLDVIADEKLLEKAELLGRLLRARLANLEKSRPGVAIAHLRGLGPMIGFDVLDPATGKPDGARARRVTGRALARGLVILTCGSHGETIRILVPLTAPESIVNEGLDVLEAALAERTDTA